MARSTIGVYRFYNFTDKDPVIDELRTMMADEGLNVSQLHQLSGVGYGTLQGWFTGKTRRPQNPTVSAVGEGMGYHRRFVRKQGWKLADELLKAQEDAKRSERAKRRAAQANNGRKRKRK